MYLPSFLQATKYIKRGLVSVAMAISLLRMTVFCLVGVSIVIVCGV